MLVGRGAIAVDARRQIGIAEQTLYRWSKEYGGLDGSATWCRSAQTDRLSSAGSARHLATMPLGACAAPQGRSPVRLPSIEGVSRLLNIALLPSRPESQRKQRFMQGTARLGELVVHA